MCVLYQVQRQDLSHIFYLIFFVSSSLFFCLWLSSRKEVVTDHLVVYFALKRTVSLLQKCNFAFFVLFEGSSATWTNSASEERLISSY